MTQRIPHPKDAVDVRRAFQRLSDTFFDESSDVNHDETTGFVATEHIDHASVSILAGTGLAGGGTIEESRTLSLSHLGIESLTGPGADRILFWDQSEVALGWLEVGAGLTIADTVLSVSAAGVDHGGLAGLGDDDHPQYLLADGSRNLTGNLAVDAAVTIDGRDLSVDGGKLDGIEAGADVTDAVNVAAAGAAMAGGAFHDGFSDFVAAEHVALPSTIAAVLTDHDLAAHTALGLFDSSSDVDHGGVGGLGDDDHTQYFLADGSRDITGNFIFSPATHDFLIRDNSVSGGGNRGRIAVQCQTAGEQIFVDLFTKDGDGTDDIGFALYAVGSPTSITNSELLEFRWDGANSEFAMDTLENGTGTLRPINIYTEGNRGQLYIDTDGSIGIGTTNPFATLDIDGTLIINPGSHEMLFRDGWPGEAWSLGRLAIQSRQHGYGTFIDLHTRDGDGTDDLGFVVWAKGIPEAQTNRELAQLGYDSADAEFVVNVIAAGTGTSRPISLYTYGNRPQLFLATDGKVGVGKIGPATALDVDGTITGTTISGANVTSGADPGHTHTGTSLPDVESLGTSLTAGSVVFSDGSNLAQDNAYLFWNAASNFLGVGTANPQVSLQVHKEGEQLRLSDTSVTDNYSYFRSNDDGTNIILEIDQIALSNTRNVYWRIWRNLNTTGEKAYRFHRGNGTTTVDLQFGVDGADCYFAGGGFVGINEKTPQDALEVNGRILVKDKVCFTQDDRNEYIDSLDDGYLDYGATTGHRFNTTVDINSDIIRLRTTKTPASAGAAGNQGDICWDADFIYVCVAANTWKKAAITTW